MSCLHEYEYEGCRTYGANIPGYAQGAYFPGDAPGLRRKLTGEGCPDQGGEDPQACAKTANTEYICPDCLEAGQAIALKKDGHGQIFCPKCGMKFPDADAIAASLSWVIRDMLADMAYTSGKLTSVQTLARDWLDSLKKLEASIATSNGLEV